MIVKEDDPLGGAAEPTVSECKMDISEGHLTHVAKDHGVVFAVTNCSKYEGKEHLRFVSFTFDPQ